MAKMNNASWIALIVLAACVGVIAGFLICGKCQIRGRYCSRLVAEGPIHSAIYEISPGKTEGFTRINESRAVPGGTGSWNENRYGKLYRNFLIVTKPSETGWGTQVIPTDQLIQVHFAAE